MNELLHTIWLSLSCTAGSETFARLLTRFNSPADIYYADDEKIASCISSGSRDYKSLINKDTGKAERILKLCESKNIGIITYFDSGFPAGLRRIKNPPVLLYYRGRLPDFENEFFISIVGTRRLSVYGRSNTFKIARDIARAGATVVSGMAIGIDGVALAGAISAGKGTVGVIGCGIDVCYPKCHKRLAREIVKLGCVMTEYAPGVRPDRFNFPKRNRIISALSEATVVMEGSERSGSVITARHAIEQGRTLYAFPGNVGNSGSEASNLLIKNGAKLLTSADDIIRDFEKSSLGKLNPFNLTGSDSYDMYSVLREFEVSC
ncbi:MAG: DNA-processing protein DprA, partial [Clostridia bacterium]|nr:DNA-processing protein DprA [Clostridia bacterium]